MELPYLAVQSILFVCIVYPLIAYINTAAHFFFYLLMTFLALNFFLTFGTALVYLTPTLQMANVVGAGMAFFFSLYNGFLIPYPTMPVYFQWANRCAACIIPSCSQSMPSFRQRQF